MPTTARTIFLPALSIAAASIGATYTALGSPTPNPIPVQALYISGNLDHDVWFSTDGVHDMIFVPTGILGFPYPLLGSYDMLALNGIPANTQWFIRYDGVATTTGKIALMQAGRSVVS